MLRARSEPQPVQGVRSQQHLRAQEAAQRLQGVRQQQHLRARAAPWLANNAAAAASRCRLRARPSAQRVQGVRQQKRIIYEESLKGSSINTKTRWFHGAHTPGVVFWPRSNRTAAMRDGAVPAFDKPGPACALGCTLTAPLPFWLGEKCSAAALFSTGSRATTRGTRTKWKDSPHH